MRSVCLCVVMCGKNDGCDVVCGMFLCTVTSDVEYEMRCGGCDVVCGAVVVMYNVECRMVAMMWNVEWWL